MNGKIDVAAIGEVLIDFAQESVDALGYPTMAAHPGGAPCNFLAALSALGMKTAFLGKVGEDDFGLMLRHTLDSAGIDTRGLVSDPDVFTTLAFVRFDKNRDRSFSFARKPGADTRLRSDELDLTVIDECRMLHFGTLSLTDEPARSATQAAVEYARRCGKLISFDPNLREPLWPSLDAAAEQMLWGLKNADVVKISGEEAEFLFGGGCEKSAELILNNCGAKLVMITLGSEGCFIKNRAAQCRVPAARVKAADTTGAGDIFGGSAAYCLLSSGKAPEDLNEEELNAIGRFACAAAGLSVQRPGGISSVPGKEEILALLAAGD
jgi:fructokinase